MLRFSGESIASTAHGHTTGCVYADPERGIFLIVDALHQEVDGSYFVTTILPLLRARLERETGSLEERVREAITLANNELFDTSSAQSYTPNIACSITVIVIDQTEAVIGHVGNTVAYLLNPYTIKGLTPEHQVAGTTKPSSHSIPAKDEAPTILSEPVVAGIQKHEPEDADFIYFNQFPFPPESALLLCSSNFSADVTPDVIFRTVRQQPGNRARVVQALIQAATAAGCESSFSVLFTEGKKFASALRAQLIDRGLAYARSTERTQVNFSRNA